MGHWAKPPNLLGAFVLIILVVISAAETQEQGLGLSGDAYSNNDDYSNNSDYSYNGDYSDYYSYDDEYYYGDYYSHGYSYGDDNDSFTKPNADDDSHRHGYSDEDYIYQERPENASTWEQFNDSGNDDLTLLEEYLPTDCQMTKISERNITSEDDIIEPVIEFDPFSSISIITDSNESWSVNLTMVPFFRPMAARFDISSKILSINPTQLISINLLEQIDHDGIVVPSIVTFQRLRMTFGNCTTGLPFTKLKNEYFMFFKEHNEIIIFSKHGYGYFEITVVPTDVTYEVRLQGNDIIMSLSRGSTYILDICYSEGKIIPKYTRYDNRCSPIPTRQAHRLTFSIDPETNKIKANGIPIASNVEHGAFQFRKYPANLTIIFCLYTCPRRTELTTPPGNTTEKPGPTCVIDSGDLANLVVTVSVMLCILMVTDMPVAVQYLKRRFLGQPTELNPEILQWHLKTKPIPHIWQIPPPLPDRPPPTVSGNQVVEEDEEEREEDLGGRG